MPTQTTTSDWESAARSADEQERVRALHALGILESGPDEYLDRLMGLASRIFGIPVAAISLIDADRQWHKSCSTVHFDGNVSRDQSFCTHIVESKKSVMIVEDALQDPLFRQNSLVNCTDGIRFYAGSLIKSKAGHGLGSFCLIDFKPRQLTEQELERFIAFGELVEAEVQRYGEQRRHHSHLAQELLYDGLTGLPNRRLLCERMTGFYELTGDTSASATLAVVNPLRFRAINQALGREKADELLRQIGRRLSCHAPRGSTVAHLHEDRFAILLPDLHQDPGAEPVEQVIKCLQEPFEFGHVSRRIDFSIGTAALDSRQSTPAESLIDQAQLALRSIAIHTGTAVAAFDGADEMRLARNFGIETRLRAAIGTDAFQIVYQPIVRLPDRRIVGAEALVRLNVEGVPVSPADFIPIAEETGLIHLLSKWILTTSCQEFMDYCGDVSGLHLSVNIGGQELLEEGFAERVRQTLAMTGLAPSALRLEVTEHSVIGEMERAIAQMQRVTAQGVAFSIDDFGTGHASLRYLQLLPARVLKIDRSFVDGTPLNERDAAITRATIALGRSLGMQLVAEGVETEAQCAFLSQEGAHFGQGWLFGRPVSITDFAELLVNQRSQLDGDFTLHSLTRTRPRMPKLKDGIPLPKPSLE